MKIRALVAAASLVVALAPHIGSGSHGDSCGGSWRETTGVRDCPLAFTGFPLTAYATACKNDTCRTGATSVRAWITISTTAQVVLECEAAGTGFASCSNELSPATALSTIAGTVPLTCHVEGTGAGVYGCGSGCINPSQGPVCEVLATPLPTP